MTVCQHCDRELVPCERIEFSCQGWVHAEDRRHVCVSDGIYAIADPHPLVV